MKKLVVLTKNKLNATDTICPLLLELKKFNPNLKIIFIVPRLNTLKELKKNFVLYEALFETSKIKYIHGKYKILNRVRSAFLLLSLFYNSLIGSKFIHFGFFDYFPYKFLLFFKSNSFYHMQNEAYFSSQGSYQAKVRNMGLYFLFNTNDSSIINIALSKNIIVNSDKSFYFNHPNASKKNFFVYGPSRSRKVWIDYIASKQYHFENLFINQNYKIIFYPLATFSPTVDLKNKNSFLELFKDTIEVLSKVKNIIVLLKPHIYTDMQIVNKMLSRFESNNFKITYLHPSLLINNSDICICNLYTTIFAEAYLKNVYTLEYTDYSADDLKFANNKSQVPEYTDCFINKSSHQNPKEILIDSINKAIISNKRNENIVYGADKNSLVKILAKN